LPGIRTSDIYFNAKRGGACQGGIHSFLNFWTSNKFGDKAPDRVVIECKKAVRGLIGEKEATASVHGDYSFSHASENSAEKLAVPLKNRQTG